VNVFSASATEVAFSVRDSQSAQEKVMRPPPGFTDHGAVARVAQSVWTGAVPAVDGAGRRIILFKLWGKTPPALYLMIDAETGQTTSIDPGLNSAGAYATFLSPDNKFYDSLGDQFIEFDVASKKIIPVGKIPADFIMSFTIDDRGVIYAGLYPNGELLAFNPKTRVLTNFGPLAKETWPQYLYLATDDKGWVYGCVNFVRGNVLALNPETGEKRQIYPEDKRGFRDGAEIWRGKDGQVYSRLGKDEWYKLYDGSGAKIEGAPTVDRAIFTSTVTPPGRWRDGSFFSNLSVPGRRVSINDAGADKPREILFDYQCAGRPIYSIVGGPDGKIYGATGIPLRVFCYDPATGKTQNWGLADYGGHVNQWVRQGNKLYGAVYSDGALLEYDPAKPFEDAPIGKGANPRLAFRKPEARDLFGRPHAMLAHPDGHHVLIGGNPARGLAGGGLLIYDTQKDQGTILTRDDLIADQGITAMTALSNGDIIIGTTTEPGTGGTGTAKEAMVYRLDWRSRKITSKWTPIPGLKSIADLITGPDGLVYGLAAPDHFFVINPKSGQVVHREEITGYGSVTGAMAPRTMALGPDRKIYALFSEAIARIAPGTFSHAEIARPGVPIKAGIVIQDGRLYFSSDANLWSYDLSGFSEKRL
jgi:outer membrane protein assembly factor BamB